MDFVECLGIAAAALITVANLPQAIKLVRTKSTDDISAVTYFLLVSGNAAWLCYGILKHDLPILIGNAISTLLCALILAIKFLYGNKKKRD